MWLWLLRWAHDSFRGLDGDSSLVGGMLYNPRIRHADSKHSVAFSSFSWLFSHVENCPGGYGIVPMYINLF